MFLGDGTIYITVDMSEISQTYFALELRTYNEFYMPT